MDMQMFLKKVKNIKVIIFTTGIMVLILDIVLIFAK